MPDPTLHRHPTGLAFRARRGAAVVELFFCADRGRWLCGPVADDGTVRYSRDPVALPAPGFDVDGVDEGRAREIAAAWFGGERSGR